MGAVYRGEHVVIGKPVALKVLHPRLTRLPQVVDRFLIEARAASMIRHPNIVDVTDFGELPDGRPFFVMEYLEGLNLEQTITREGQLPLYRAVNILRQVSRALYACHQQGVVHRDLKPENIVLLRREGNRDLVELPTDSAMDPTVRKEDFWDEVRILDFGVAQIQEMTASLDAETREQGIVFGSPYYVSPEQATGKTGDHRSDIYALGVMFFEMLTGKVPFDGETAQQIMTQHTQVPPPSLRQVRPDLELPAEAEALVQRSMAKRPQDRHRSAAHFFEDLSQCFGDVIYGRDIQRYLAVERRRTRQIGSDPRQALGRPGKGAPATSAPFTEHGAAGRAPTGAGPSADSDTVAGADTGAGAGSRTGAETGAGAGSPGRRLHGEKKHGRLSEQLDELFRGKYEPPRPVTENTLEAIRTRSRQRQRRTPDPLAVREELKGLFGADDEGDGGGK
jgi:serine/threonine protein kinase